MRLGPRKAAAASFAACLFILLHHMFVQQRHSQPSASVIKDSILAAALTPADLPGIPLWNLPPEPHVAESTPLLIGFSQNWPMLEQALVSYLTAGWPASDIYIIDNTGTMFSNRRAQLTINNPCYLDYSRLEMIYQVNVLTTPTLLSFAQLQNFYLHEALDKGWAHYFWSHMDVVALSVLDGRTDQAYQSLYLRAVEDLRSSFDSQDWAIRFYAYDRLSLVSVSAFDAVGGWDPFMPYYPADCDMYERLNMKGYHNPSPDIGQIFDVKTTLEDVSTLYTIGRPGSHSYEALYQALSALMRTKIEGERNTWQTLQQGGQNEPYHYDSRGVAVVREAMIVLGRKIFRLKWGTTNCRLYTGGSRATDAWTGSWW